tara:strand:+ start:306 stop:578 length:273 start_codon:yes stop_codon:yes gene_type:complete
MLPLNLINEYMQKLNGWALEGDSIVKDFDLPDFPSAIEFVNNVAELAERREHHPGILINGNQVRLNLTTHSEQGLTSKDFELAEEIDKIN